MPLTIYDKAKVDDLLSTKIDEAPIDGTTYGRKDGAWEPVVGGSTSWGSITGTLSSQTDLQTALDSKLGPKSVYTLTGSYTLASGDANNIVYCPQGAGGGFGLTITIPDDATYSFPVGTIITLCVDNSTSGTNISFAQGNPGSSLPYLAGPIVGGGISSSTSGHFFITKVAADLWILS